MTENKPFLSVVVPFYNAERTIGKCLSSIERQDYPREKYEIIGVDDGSVDRSYSIASKYTDKIIKRGNNSGPKAARKDSFRSAGGDIIVSVDSDAVIRENALSRIADFFKENPGISAMSGLLAKENPGRGFFSQYKNLYMHYNFKKLSKTITFIYGTLFAVRKEAAGLFNPAYNTGEDTEFGQALTRNGKEIAFADDLEAVHLKEYTIFSFIKNDFSVPFHWAKIFLRHKGWRELFRRKGRFAHASAGQLANVILAPAIIAIALTNAFLRAPMLVEVFLLILWLCLNAKFFRFLLDEKGYRFAAKAVLATFMDNLVMATGIAAGFCMFFVPNMRKE